MITAAILSVGTELTTGRIQDSHGRFLGAQLGRLGVSVGTVRLVPDDYRSMIREIGELVDRFDLLIVTGGLGPTSDDMTREAVAEAGALRLLHNEEVWKDMRRRYAAVVRSAGANRKQALIPEGFTVLPNGNGTAPGFLGRMQRCRVVCLPGPPRELRPMFLDQVLPVLERDLGVPERDELAVSVFLVPESLLEEELRAACGPAVTWGTQVEEDRIRLFLRGGEEGDRQSALQLLRGHLGPVRVRAGDLRPLDAVFDLLQARKQTVAVAESCTGGYLSKVFTDRPGSSNVFLGGLVTYSNEAKIRLLGVEQDAITLRGAVSDQVVRQMAVGVCGELAADWGIGISGIAGPTGGSPEKPVGTVWIGVARGEEPVFSRIFHFSGPRDLVRRRAVYVSLLMLEQCVLNAERLDIIFNW